MDIERQGNEILAHENLNSISTITPLDTLVEDDKRRSSVWHEFLVIDGANFSDGKKREMLTLQDSNLYCYCTIWD